MPGDGVGVGLLCKNVGVCLFVVELLLHFKTDLSQIFTPDRSC